LLKVGGWCFIRKSLDESALNAPNDTTTKNT
jgi:hypothetical protein